MTNFYPPHPVVFHPGFDPAPPPPPPRGRHPSLWDDMDTYSRKEVDQLLEATLAAAKAYTDAKVAEAISGLIANG